MKCSVSSCTGKVRAKGFCHKHYLQWIRHGKTLEKTRFDKNDIIINGNTAYVILRDNNGLVLERAVIDTKEVELVRGHKWRLERKGKVNVVKKYAMSGRSPKVAMHRLIMNAQPGDIVDHKDGDGLNNRRENLVICTVAENAWNWFYSKSKYRGVYFHKRTGKWSAELHNLGRKYYLGLFETQEEAAIAYNQKAIELRGAGAKGNEV